jgi:hypothetical protein
MAQRNVPPPQWLCVVTLLSIGTLVFAEDFPTLRPGLWEYQRTTQRSDQAWVPKDITERVCEDPNAALRKHSEAYSQLGCVITTEKTDSENTYRLNAECLTKNGGKVVSYSITTFDGDRAYTSVIDSTGWLGGIPVQFAERVIAKRLSDCEKPGP